jgi:hypothetical protein
MTKRLSGLFEHVFTEAVADEHAFAETQRIAFVVQRFDIERRKRAHYESRTAFEPASIAAM